MSHYSSDFLVWFALKQEKEEEPKGLLFSPFMDLFRRAIQHHEAGERIQAASCYYQILNAPLSEKAFVAFALNNLAWILLTCKPLYDSEEALKLALQADLLRDSTDAETLDTLAECYFRRGNYTKALEMLQRAIHYCDQAEYKQNYLLPREKAFREYATQKNAPIELKKRI